MEKGNQTQQVFRLINLYIDAKRFQGDLSSRFLPLMEPSCVWGDCAKAAELYYRFWTLLADYTGPKELMINPQEENIPLNALSYPEGFDGRFTFYKHKEIPLTLWGQILDYGSGDDYWKNFCLNMLNEKGGIKAVRKNLEYKDWFKQWDIIRNFLNWSLSKIDEIIRYLVWELESFDVNRHPNARLVLVEYELKNFREVFLREVAAVGPYSFKHSDWFICADDDNLNVDSKPGILRTEQAALDIQCTLTQENEHTVEWRITEWSVDTMLSKEMLIPSYEWALFDTWSYDTGEFLGSLETEGKAYWHVTDTSQIAYAAELTEEAAFPLIPNSDYESLANRAIKVVRNNLPQWRPGKVRWSYVKEIDEVTCAYEYARKLYEMKHSMFGVVEDNNIPGSRRKTTKEIPPESKSPPMSLKELAGYFGQHTSPRKISNMVRSGILKAEMITRESYYFDLRMLPGYVCEKIKSSG